MTRPEADIAAVIRASRSLLNTVSELTDARASTPSALPNWTRAEVLTHLARNADSVRGLADAAARGEVGVQYPGGPEQRAHDIAAGRGGRASVLVAELRRAHDAMVESWDELALDAWEHPTRSLVGERPMYVWPWVRWREVELHHVDVDMGYSCVDWPIAFVHRCLKEAMKTLPERALPARPSIDVRYRVTATDHDRSWVVTLRSGDATVDVDDGGAVDTTIEGWGSDVLAWLYGRAPAGETLAADTDDSSALQLPAWFPYP